MSVLVIELTFTATKSNNVAVEELSLRPMHPVDARTDLLISRSLSFCFWASGNVVYTVRERLLPNQNQARPEPRSPIRITSR